jgi:hypothetical protein
MNSPSVFVKTKKGIDEMLARKPSINAGIGSVLLFVDGSHSEQDLLALILKNKLPADSLIVLEHAGFIERRSFPFENSRPMTDMELRQARATAESEATSTAFLDAYRFLVSQTKSRLGLRGLSFQFKLERAQNMDDLRTLLGPLGDAVAKTQGLSVANAFIQECRDHMSDQQVREQSLKLVEEARQLQASKPQLRRVA